VSLTFAAVAAQATGTPLPMVVIDVVLDAPFAPVSRIEPTQIVTLLGPVESYRVARQYAEV
jgi:hypothetical protein